MPATPDPFAPAAPLNPVWNWSRIGVLAAAALLAAGIYGHFIKPHGDFFEFRSVGLDLLAGHMPETTKRGPLFPLTIALLERLAQALTLFIPLQRPAAQLSTEALNAGLLVLNAALVWALVRRWCGRAATWWTAWFIFLPVGLYCTAHALAEPLLLCLTLATLELAERRSPFAWAAASAAILVRFDVAGLLLGLLFVAPLERRPAWRPLLLSLVAPAAWLLLTVATWSAHSGDHYLRQIFESRGNWSWNTPAVLSLLLPADGLQLPVWAADWQAPTALAVSVFLMCAATVGLATLLRLRAPAACAGAGMAVGYLLVHGVFPFEFDRFGYPLAVLALLAASAGLAQLARWVAATGIRGVVLSRLVLGLLMLLIGTSLWTEGNDLRALLAARPHWSRLAPAAGILAAVSLAFTGLRASFSDRATAHLARITLVSATLLLAVAQLRVALPLLGTGDEMRGLDAVARWAKANLPADEFVISGFAGELRLICGDEPAGRFLSLNQIPGDTWDTFVTECRRRGIRILGWHAEAIGEPGGYYIEQWRLDRFRPLEGAVLPAGLSVLHRDDAPPEPVFFTIAPAPAASSSGGAATNIAPGPGGSTAPFPPQTPR